MSILVSIIDVLDEKSVRNSSRFEQLDQRTQLIITSLLDHNIWAKKSVEITKEIRNQLGTIIDLVSRVDTIGTNAHHRVRNAIANEQVGGLRNHPFGKMAQILSRFEILDVSDDQESMIRGRVQNSILASLAYPSMTERYQDIIETYSKTFEWAFENPTIDQLPWSNLSE